MQCPINPGPDECPCLDPASLPEGVLNVCDPIHHHFELSYASYLVLPRSLLQSMPEEWQARFVLLLRELDNSFDVQAPPEGCHYRVTCRDRRGSLVEDPLADYERGRRKIPIRGEKPPCPDGQHRWKFSRTDGTSVMPNSGELEGHCEVCGEDYEGDP